MEGDSGGPQLVLHILPILLQQGLEAGMVAEGVPSNKKRAASGTGPYLTLSNTTPSVTKNPVTSPSLSR